MIPDLDWLLTLEIGGRILRYSSTTRVVDGEVYAEGLDVDLTASAGTGEDVTLAVYDEELREVVLVHDSGTGTLALLDGEDVEVYHSGTIVGLSWGDQGESVELTLSRDVSGLTRGRQVPAETARVDSTTWPVDVSGEIGTSGGTYPVILGYPGHIATGTDPVPCVPVPLAQLTASAATTLFVVSEDPDAPITSVRLRYSDADVEIDQGVSTTADLLGQGVRAADCSTGGSTSIPASASVSILAGYSDAGGGGVARGLYDVIRYVLRRWGPDSADWERLHEIEAALEVIQVDSWVAGPVEDPWVLIEHWTAELPVAIRVSEAGRYLTQRRYTHDPARVVAELVDPVREGRVQRDGDPINEVSVLYRHDSEQWRSQVLAVGSRLEAQPAGSSLDPVQVIETDLARRSWSRYQRRPGPAISLDWTWDTGTARAVAAAVLERSALPAVLASYRVRHDQARGLREGDEVLITDAGQGWDARPAILDGPPEVGLESVLLALRIPEL